MRHRVECSIVHIVYSQKKEKEKESKREREEGEREKVREREREREIISLFRNIAEARTGYLTVHAYSLAIIN